VGVTGNASGHVARVVDPEALFALTCTFGRYDPRLFDEVLDWMAIHDRFVNIQRMKNVFSQSTFAGRSAMSASTRALQRATGNAKWRLLAEDPIVSPNVTPFFLLPDGRPIPTRGKLDPDFKVYGLQRAPVNLRRLARVFSPEDSASLLLKLRALLGVNARSEILLFLLCNRYGNSHEIARHTHYFQKTIHDALTDLECSGYVESTKTGRERRFYMSSSELSQALIGGGPAPLWVDWPGILAPIETFWRSLDGSLGSEEDERTVASELYFMSKRLAESHALRENVASSATPKPNRPPQEYLRYFLDALQVLK
jgi:DNA-binding MarR family transcriptional regulator